MDVFDFMDDKIEVPHYPWFDTVKFKLVTTEKDLVALIDLCIANKRYAIDLEATGVDTRVFNGETKDKIVGVCLAPDRDSGYYVPVRHREGANIPMSIVRREMLRLTQSNSVAIFHNAKYDQELLQFNGGEPWGKWENVKFWEDTIILAYLRNSRERDKGLKTLTKKELGLEMIELYELWGHAKKKKNFHYDYSGFSSEWEPILYYAASDAICTYRLWEALHPTVVSPKNAVKDQKLIYAIEKACMTATRWMERSRIKIDIPKVKELISLGQRELMEALEEVFKVSSEQLGRDITPLYFYLLKEEVKKKNPKLEIADDKPSLTQLIDDCRKKAKVPLLISRDSFLKEKSARVPHEDKRGVWPAEYDIISPQKLGMMLDELKVPYLQRTDKSGQVKTSKDALDVVLEKAGKKFPWLAKIKRFRETQKALSTYLVPLFEDKEPTDDTILVNFNPMGTDTGRFSVRSGNFEKDGGCSIPFHGMPSTYDPNRPECLARLRECIVAREGKLIVAIDFAGEELRIVTNMSREPKWLVEFFRCSGCDHRFNDQGEGNETPDAPPAYCPNCGSDKIGDIHTLTCLSVYGDHVLKDPRFKMYRGNSKAVNFALSYGGSGKAVERSIGCDENEGARIKDKFDKSYLTLAQWWAVTKRYAKKKGFVKTAFGRIYPVPDILLPRRDVETGRSNWSFISKAERNCVNGPVQGTGADIIKIAMAKVYGHVMKRGWEEKVYLLATMHDELVFEIDEDILEQAIDEIEDIMTSNKIILSKKWPVPFTTDVEIGKNWTVPWDLGKYRGGKKPWPEELKSLFKSGVEYVEKETSPEKVETREEKPKKIKENKSFLTYEVKQLSISALNSLGMVVNECMGDTPLLLIHKGEPIPLPYVPLIDEKKFLDAIGGGTAAKDLMEPEPNDHNDSQKTP